MTSDTIHSLIGLFLHADGTLSAHPDQRRKPLGVVFADECRHGDVWVVALDDTPCFRETTERGLPHRQYAHSLDEVLAIGDGYCREHAADIVEWQVPTARQWERIIVDLFGCPLYTVRDGGPMDGAMTFSGECAACMKSLLGIGTDMSYWTGTREDNGDTWIVTADDIRPEPMPYTKADDEWLGDMALRMVGRVKDTSVFGFGK